MSLVVVVVVVVGVVIAVKPVVSRAALEPRASKLVRNWRAPACTNRDQSQPGGAPHRTSSGGSRGLDSAHSGRLGTGPSDHMAGSARPGAISLPRRRQTFNGISRVGRINREATERASLQPASLDGQIGKLNHIDDTHLPDLKFSCFIGLGSRERAFGPPKRARIKAPVCS